MENHLDGPSLFSLLTFMLDPWITSDLGGYASLASTACALSRRRVRSLAVDDELTLLSPARGCEVQMSNGR